MFSKASAQNTFSTFIAAILVSSTVLLLSVVGCQHSPDAPADNSAGTPAATPSDASDGIVKGKTATSRDLAAASVVALVSQLDQGQALCTGTVLDESTILTAAHCVDHDPSQLKIVFAQNLNTVTADRVRDADCFKQNPKWGQNSKRGRGDIALIHFEGGLPEGVQPVELAGPKIDLTAGVESYFLGFGVTDGITHAGAGVLRWTTSKITAQASSTEVVTDGTRSSVCFGDSGGPAFVVSAKVSAKASARSAAGRLLQWGVASSVTNSNCSAAAIHTDIRSYRRWIAKTMAELADPASQEDN